MRIVNVTQTASIVGINQLLVCTSQNPIAVTLSRSASGTHGGYYIKNIGVGAVTVTPQVNDLIDGQATWILAQYEAINIIDYDTNTWIILSHDHV